MNDLMERSANGTRNFSSAKLDLTFYPNLERIGDLANVNSAETGLLINPNQIQISPSRNLLDPLAISALEELSNGLNSLKAAPSRTNVLQLEIGELILEDQLEAAPNYLLRAKLEQEGFTGELVQASRRLNTSLSDFNRQILSREGLFFYLAYRVIIGLEVSDVDGIISNMLSAIDVLRAYLNKDLVDRVIEDQSLEIDEAERVQLKDWLSDRAFSYAPGQIIPAVLREFDQLKKGMGLWTMVMTFLNSGEVKLPYGADKEKIAKAMIEYLLDLGYNPSEVDNGNPALDAVKRQLELQLALANRKIAALEASNELLVQEIDEIRAALQLDDLKSIKGIFVDEEKMLHDCEVYTFRQIFMRVSSC